MSYKNKKAHITSEEIIKWILYIALLTAVSFSVYKIVGNLA